MSNKQTGIVFKTVNYESQKKFVYILDQNSDIESFHCGSKNFDFLEPFSIVELLWKNSAKNKVLISVEVKKKFPALSENYLKNTLACLWFDLIQNFIFDHEYNWYKLVYNNLEFLNLLDDSHCFNYIIYVFSVIFLIDGYLNIKPICEFCGKSLLEYGGYFHIQHNQLRCMEHKQAYSFFLPSEYLYYLSELNENFHGMILVPNFSFKKTQNIFGFFKKWVYILRDEKSLRIFKSLNYFFKSDD